MTFNRKLTKAYRGAFQCFRGALNGVRHTIEITHLTQIDIRFRKGCQHLFSFERYCFYHTKNCSYLYTTVLLVYDYMHSLPNNIICYLRANILKGMIAINIFHYTYNPYSLNKHN